jgi:membrane protease YdiL (CAAX protease family)
MDQRDDARAELVTFLVLTFALSAVFWWLIIAAGSLGAGGGLYVLALMWSPGVSALVTRLVFHRSVRGLGWRLGAPRWLVLAYVLPLGYAGLAYGSVWLTGLGGVDLSRFTTGVGTFIALGTLQSLLSATGEEIGWRGFLVPALAKRMSFGRTAVVSGAIWAAWHAPLIVLADYNAGTPTWYSLLWFSVMVLGISVPFAWLRLRSGSLWPAAILHATHNLFVQAFFDRVTVDTGPTRWLTTEFGAALALAGVVTGWLFWRARDAVTRAGDPLPVSVPAAAPGASVPVRPA